LARPEPRNRVEEIPWRALIPHRASDLISTTPTPPRSPPPPSPHPPPLRSPSPTRNSRPSRRLASSISHKTVSTPHSTLVNVVRKPFHATGKMRFSETHHAIALILRRVLFLKSIRAANVRLPDMPDMSDMPDLADWAPWAGGDVRGAGHRPVSRDDRRKCRCTVARQCAVRPARIDRGEKGCHLESKPDNWQSRSPPELGKRSRPFPLRGAAGCRGDAPSQPKRAGFLYEIHSLRWKRPGRQNGGGHGGRRPNIPPPFSPFDPPSAKPSWGFSAMNHRP
jgi:hypothetical protein